MAKLAEAVERMLFARTPGETGSLREDVRRVRRALAATVSRGRRIRAVLLPPSTLLRARALGTRMLDGFDRLENIRIGRPPAGTRRGPPAAAGKRTGRGSGASRPSVRRAGPGTAGGDHRHSSRIPGTLSGPPCGPRMPAGSAGSRDALGSPGL
nr:hypothetical protein GCM10020093_114930 [Planobispora longispora]